MSFEPGLRSFEEYPAELELEADVCVIGAGAGGCAGAAALAAGGKRGVVLEEGRHWRPKDFRPSAPWAMRHLYQEGGTRAAAGNGLIIVNGGRGVGGSTLINSAICFRTPEVVLETWREEHGCETLANDRVRALNTHVLETIGAVVNPIGVQRQNNLIFKKGVEALGLKGDWLVRSAPGCSGCAVCQLGCPSGGKLSVDRTFLARAVRTGRVGVYADCRATGVETDGGRVTAVTGRFIDPDALLPAGRFRVRAEQFLLSGGPIGSPRFLMRNGLSSSEHLGQHLFLHPALGVFARFPFDIIPWTGVSQGYYVDRYEEGYLLQTVAVSPDQFYIGLAVPPSELMEYAADLRYFAMCGPLIHDEDSVGSVGETLITYTLGDGDRQRLIAGLREACRVYFAAGADLCLVGAVGAGAIRSVDEIDRKLSMKIKARELLAIASHPMGTCRMGGDPATSVISPRGRVWEWENLFVADASVFASSLGVNPQVTVMTMGLLVGEEMLEG